MNETFDRPTNAEHLASVMSGAGTVRLISKMKPVLARLPESQLAELDAMAKLSGKSRSAMVVHLLDVAFQEVRRVASPDLRSKLDADTFQVLQALQSDQDSTEAEEA